MTNQNNPTEHVILWVNQFSPRERDELSALVLCSLLPGSPDTFDSSALLNWLEQVGNLSARQVVGHLLAFISAVEFFALPDRGTESGWDHLLSVNEAVLNALLAKGHGETYVSPLSEALREIPLRRKRWLQQAERWQTLRKSFLSDNALQRWLKVTDKSWLLVPL